MTPKEKSNELISKFCSIMMNDLPPGSKEYAETLHLTDFAQYISNKTIHMQNQAKKMALLHVDEIMKLGLVQSAMKYGLNYVNVKDYYSQVMDELNKL